MLFCFCFIYETEIGLKLYAFKKTSNFIWYLYIDIILWVDFVQTCIFFICFTKILKRKYNFANFEKTNIIVLQ